MKHIYLNLKRFDVPASLGGVNRLAPMDQWAKTIVESTRDQLEQYDKAEFVQFFPEAHLLEAVKAKKAAGKLQVGCQGVFREDVTPGGNFGAFTTNAPAAAMRGLGCTHVLIGHCEERMDKKGVLAEAGVEDASAVNRLLNKEILCAVKAGMKVVYCIGETAQEQSSWETVLTEQLQTGLAEVDKEKVVIAYEPVWSIGPGKTPADKPYITKVARLVKEVTGGMDVVYGGGLKENNAQMLASIDEIDGGLIALTRFGGDFGFYPEEYLRIVNLYLKGEQK